MKKLFLALAVVLFCTPQTWAALENNDALAGLTQTKAVFDINQGNPDRLKLRLQLIEMSYQQLKKAGVTPDFVLTFRGKASFFLTSGLKYITIEDREVQQEIQALLRQFKSRGIPLEQCAIAANLAGIDFEDFIPEIKLVANGYISLMGYQNRGYAFIPME